MTFLSERIRRGEAAIARAKAQGRDVTTWDAHLKKLKEQAQPIAFEDSEAPYSLTEIRVLQGKPDHILKTVHEVKVIFGGGRVLQ